ncbi:gamma-glutamyl-CDP-amidate hydrolase [Campylobacter cuniculorum]|uniref:Gamma-glutamyl-gamma-aminobutyrate hydrolase n=2 Tax=Campylobacter cuniculorum TaxID=374106 RepID=W6A0A0_9BACT|nr:gamma-glutamyl-CDP-amidate hydrolase [Campylobacter cuniculorum]AHI44370.1 type I glutamine amidotransferase [Campylobacter cuniculorum DSM 23162 = LMG 24588]ARJ56893.1 gamma-glutamyl-gamma-aminobutyrate hydrolase [Campylobacter cuniculorum DSM 23162 = LMG 24588]QOR04355.1 gamma-glutamyl-gamma-aminobutyrate hydrolase family protein [Campylobacter cuniculorum]
MFIGITQRLILNESYYEEREALALDWGKLFAHSNLLKDFLPLPLSYEFPFNLYKKHLKAVILSGGNDLNCYNPNALSLKRDAYENEIIKHCLRDEIPLLGICRGAQIIAHFFNSTLISCQNHTQEHHIINTQGETFKVNSFHNYAIEKLGKDLSPLFFAEDETIEAFKHKNAKIYGLMWHIERKEGLNENTLLKEWLESIRR